jgi:hypothetical protein
VLGLSVTDVPVHTGLVSENGKDVSPTHSHILANPRFAKSAKSSPHLRITYFELNDLLKQEPQARRRPRRLIENTILKNDESVQEANEDVGAPTS